LRTGWPTTSASVTTKKRLSHDKDEAWRLWHELMARPPEEPEKPRLPTGPDAEAIEVLDAFLDWCQRNNAARTYAWYRENIQRFVSALPDGLKVSELKRYHLTNAMEPYLHWANNTKHDFISSVKRSFSWAFDEELIDRNPIGRVKKPTREAREFAVQPDEYAEVLGTIADPNFRDLVQTAWETGSRVQELRKIEARFFDPENGRIVFPPKDAKGKKHYRIIYLPPRAREIVARLAAARPEGLLLVNADGNAWTKDAINFAFCRLQLALGRKEIAKQELMTPRPGRFRKAGVEPEKLAESRAAHREKVKRWQRVEQKLARELGTKYHLGAFRKGYAMEALRASVDVVGLAHLMGHRDPSMISKVYGQVQHDPE
jgi:integrase